MLRRGAGGGAFGQACGEQRTRLSKLALALAPTLALTLTATAVEAARVRAVEARRGAATHVFLTASKIIWPREVTPWPRYLRSSSPCSARVGVR